MELYIAEEYIEFTRIKHLSDGSVIREDMRREVADEHAAEIRASKAEVLREVAVAVGSASTNACKTPGCHRADQIILEERADRIEEGP